MTLSPLRHWKYSILRNLPGRRGLRYDRKIGKGIRDQQFAEALSAAKGTIGIDLGANFGKFTRLMAQACDHVVAFEPDPLTARRLRENLVDLPNVTIEEAAAGVSEGTVTLYRRDDFGGTDERASEGSTIIAEKSNVGDRHSVDVRIVDFIKYLRALDGNIGVMKIDIEGAEVDLLEALFDAPDLLGRISYLFVETHENRIPSQIPRVTVLKRRAMKMQRPVVNLYWD